MAVSTSDTLNGSPPKDFPFYPNLDPNPNVPRIDITDLLGQDLLYSLKEISLFSASFHTCQLAFFSKLDCNKSISPFLQTPFLEVPFFPSQKNIMIAGRDNSIKSRSAEKTRFPLFFSVSTREERKHYILCKLRFQNNSIKSKWRFCRESSRFPTFQQVSRGHEVGRKRIMDELVRRM